MGHLLRVVIVLMAATTIAGAFASRHRPRPISVHLDVHGLPIVEAEVIDPGFMPEARDVKLRAGEHGPTVTAQRLRNFAEAGPQTAIAFVMDGGEIWIGNDTFETDPAATYAGVLIPFERAIDAAELPARLPVGSELAIITYAKGATVRVPLAPIEHVSGAMFGGQRDYYKNVDTDLVAGIEEAAHQLERSKAPLKLMIIVGDGNDTNSGLIPERFGALRKRLMSSGIRVGALVVKSPISEARNDVAALTSEVHTAQLDEVADALDLLIFRLTDRIYATFDISTLPVFTGHPVELYVEMPARVIDPVMMTLGYATVPPRTWTTSNWLQACAAFSLLAMLAAFMRSLARE